MSKQPELRFKDKNGQPFGVWEKKPLSKILIEHREKSLVNDEHEVFTSSRRGLIPQSEYYSNTPLTQKDNKGFNIIPPNFITYRSRSDDRKFFFNINNLGKTGIISTYYPVFSSEIGDNYFICSLLNTKTNLLGRMSVGTSQTVLSLSILKTAKVYIPQKEEQQKISDFLGTVDKRIDGLRRKKELLEDYKKGLMQQIFSQKIRFKDDNGQTFPDWTHQPLGELCDIKTGKRDVNEGNPQGKYPFFTCAKEHTFSDNYSFDCSAILIAGNGDVGQCQKYSGKFEAYQRTYVLSEFKIDFDYLYIYLSSKFTDYVLSQKQVGAMPYIKLGTLINFSIPQPSPCEQHKIADFLGGIDAKIDIATRQFETAETFKKGLLQKMFV